MALRALVWDVDGTLAETERDGHRIAFNRAFEDEGLPWHWDVATYGELLKVTGGKERLLHWWRRVDADAAAQSEAQERVRRLHERKTAHYAEQVRAGAVVLRPGVRRLIVEARQRGIVQAIATTTTEANVRELLVATLGEAALDGFAVIGAGDVVPRKKPAPDVYEWVLERLRLPAADCLAIEDSAAGAAAAHAAGVPVLLTRSLYTEGEAVGDVLADLDGLGSHHQAASGRVQGRPWCGIVDVALLRRWQGCAFVPAGQPTSAP
jgi:HAD superfamily hydrolase (TIGR01509 family)